jgi:hypothetical protein
VPGLGKAFAYASCGLERRYAHRPLEIPPDRSCPTLARGPVCHRQATPPSTSGFPSKNFIASGNVRVSDQTAKSRSGRVIAIGTSVVRALESAAKTDGTVRAGGGRASERIARGAPLRVVDAILTGVINPVKATTSYSERSLTTGCSTVCVLPLRSETMAPMSLVTRC